jgi:signal transduction histidine kinase
MDLKDRLCAHRTLGSAPQSEIEWIARNGVLRHLDPGAVLTSKGGQVEGLHILLDGHFSIYVDRGTGRRKIMEWRGGDVMGLLPYSRLVSPPGDTVAEDPSELITVYRNNIPEMIRACPEVTAILVHVMLDRARHFTTTYLHDEKLVSLGKLAAGLAHELNNPVSAIARSAGALSKSRLAANAQARSLGALQLTPEQLALVENVHDACLNDGTQRVLSALQQEERENSIASWLKSNSVDTSPAEYLAETNISVDTLNQLAASIQGTALNAALKWIAADSDTHRLTSEIQVASSRIHDLVAAIKGFTEMDREAVPELVEIEKGLSNTLVVLRSKAKAKSVELSIAVEAALPRVNGFGSELNQVWMNLIDNAIDAVNESGRVEVKATREQSRICVRVMDNGPGIPSEIRERIFDPFFTTKPVGKGTGLGLDIVRRLVQRNNGEIELDSQPGRTEFRVTFPIANGKIG